MEIIEKFIKGKSIDQNLCEDGLFINEDFIVVVDGATSKGTILWDGKKSGRYIKDVILAALEDLDEDVEAQAAIQSINNSVKRSYKENYEFSKENPADRLEASIIIFSRKKQEIWSFGDCQCMINDELHAHDKKLDIVVSETRSLYIRLCLLEGMTKEQIMENDLGRDYIYPILKRQALFANSSDREYGYAVLDGFDINLNDIKIYKVKPGDQIVLTSDGYPRVKGSLEVTEQLLDEIIKEDPLLISRYKTTKCLNSECATFDDRTYIRFIV